MEVCRADGAGDSVGDCYGTGSEQLHQDDVMQGDIKKREDDSVGGTILLLIYGLFWLLQPAGIAGFLVLDFLVNNGEFCISCIL